jgi:hypothetical protein
MGYATVSHVQAKNVARGPYTANSKPSAEQVVGLINDCAAEIDAVLYESGYSVPVGTTAGTAPLSYLQHVNALGAAWMVERSAQASDREKDFELAYRACLNFISANGVPGLDADANVALPRYAAPLVDPIFEIGMDL